MERITRIARRYAFHVMRYAKSMLKKSISILIVLFVGISFGPRAYRHFTRITPPLNPPRPEITLTIKPGWNLRDIAEYLVAEHFASSTADVFKLTGEPATIYKNLYWPGMMASSHSFFGWRSTNVSFEGYFAPETFRVFKNATLQEVLEKFLYKRRDQYDEMNASLKVGESIDYNRTLTIASLVEDEARTKTDRALIADILVRRAKIGWALQLDSTVHYVSARTGDVYTKSKERQLDSPWNTYKYPGLPPGPICNPSLESIDSALHPQKNNYWYFLTGRDGKMYYAKTLEEHNANKRYL